MYLYLVKTRAFRAYVTAENTDQAYKMFREVLDERDYGCYSDRELFSVEVVANTGSPGFETPKSKEGFGFDDERKYDLLILGYNETD